MKTVEILETAITGKVEWAIASQHHEGPTVGGTSELIFCKTEGEIYIPQMEQILDERFPRDSVHRQLVTLNAGMRSVLRGRLEIKGPRGSTTYRHYAPDDDEHHVPKHAHHRVIDGTKWVWEQTGSWLRMDHAPRSMPTLPEAVRTFPDITPFDPEDTGSRILLAIAKAVH